MFYKKNKMKRETRILGFDDAPFDKFNDKEVLVVGTVFRGGQSIDGIISCKAKVDGSDSTNKLIDLVRKTKHRKQLQIILLKGIAVGGFNVIDINELSKKTKLPVIVVMRKQPNLRRIQLALKNLKDGDKKWRLIKKAGEIQKIGNLLVQSAGIKKEKIKEILRISTLRGHIPEPLRVAHLIASGVTEGESRGRA